MLWAFLVLVTFVSAVTPSKSQGAHSATPRLRAKASDGALHLTRMEAASQAMAEASRVASAAAASSKSILDNCGKVPSYSNARPKNYADARETKFDPEAKKQVPITFKAGDKIEFECKPGASTDGSKDGGKTFEVVCSDTGYFKPSAVCSKASKCGELPLIGHAKPTGKSDGNNIQYACMAGYSLDGKKVVAGGFGKNKFFDVKCVEFSGAYAQPKESCTPFAFRPAKETIRLYNQVFEALFVVSCKGTLKTSFGKGDAPSLSGVCGNFKESSGDCDGLVSKIKADFESKGQELDQHKKDNPKDWYEAAPAGAAPRPNINDEAQEFCDKLWGLLKMPSF